MGGVLKISDDLAWGSSGWAYDFSLARIAEAVKETDAALATRLLDGRTFDGGGNTTGYLDLRDLPAEKIALLARGAEWALLMMEELGPLGWQDTSIFPAYLELFRELVATLNASAAGRPQNRGRETVNLEPVELIKFAKIVDGRAVTCQVTLGEDGSAGISGDEIDTWIIEFTDDALERAIQRVASEGLEKGTFYFLLTAQPRFR